MTRVKDEDVLSFLLDNGRMPASHIADALGVTETAIRKRMQKLEDTGKIMQYTIHSDPEHMDRTAAIFLVTPENKEAAIAYLRDQKEVRRGHEADGKVHVECWFKDKEHQRQFMEALREHHSIKDIAKMQVVGQFK